MYIPEGIEKIAYLIKENLEGEYFEVAQMLYSREITTLLSHMAIDNGHKEVPKLMPEIVLNYLSSDDNLISNKFYTENYAPIKAHMSLVSIRSSTRAFFAREYAKNNDENTKLVLESLSTSLLESLTMVVFLAKGKEEAEIFDRKLKQLTQIKIR